MNDQNAAEISANDIQKAREIAADVVRGLGVDTEQLEVTADERGMHINIETQQSAELIGRGGANLEALSVVLKTIFFSKKIGGERVFLFVDVNGYCAAREEKMIARAREAAARVRETGYEERFPEMEAVLRRAVHLAIMEEEGVSSRSDEDSHGRRRLVVFREGE